MPSFPFHKFSGFSSFVATPVIEQHHKIDQGQNSQNDVDCIIHLLIKFFLKITLLQSNGKMLFHLLFSCKK